MRVADLIAGVRLREGFLCGVEVEVEGFGIPHDGPPGWTAHKDGSLRGDEAREFVFDGPVKLVTAVKRLAALEHALKDSRLDWSNRTSVHVHVNVSDMTFTQVMNFACLFYLFEDVLTRWSSEGTRAGNCFCLRFGDAEFIYNQLVQAYNTKSWRNLGNDRIRYAGVNWCAVTKFGSLEFRTMSGNCDSKRITTWIELLARLREKAIELRDPRDICYNFSLHGPVKYQEEIIGPNFDINLDEVYDALRRVQDLAYDINWDVVPQQPQNVWIDEVLADPRPPLNVVGRLGRNGFFEMGPLNVVDQIFDEDL